MAKNVEIRVFGKERTKETGEKFVVYSYTPNGQQFLKVAFTKECATTPKKTGYYLLTVNPKDLSIKKGKTIIDNETGRQFKENDTLFIANIASLKEDNEYEKVRQALKQSDVEDLLALDENVDFDKTFNE